MRGVFLDLGTVSNSDLDMASLQRALPDLDLHEQTGPTDVAARIAGRDVVLLNKCRITRELLAANPQLRLIALAATGVDNVDVNAARALGIAVANLYDYCTPSVAQHVFAVVLALTHRLRDYDALARRGDWGRTAQLPAFPYPIRELAGRLLGIVGHGALGRAVARIGKAFGMEVVVANRPGGERLPGRRDLHDLLPDTDVLTLHCPLTPVTRDLIAVREFGLMKPDAVLVNTARGALVDAAALAAALRAGRLGGAGLDVLDQEPPGPGHPLLEPGIPNLILTPHVAWAARESRQRCLDELALNIEAFLRGERRNRVD
jgi:glycerate dehydrogenase